MREGEEEEDSGVICFALFSLPSPPGETYVCVDLFVKLDIHAGEEGPIESHFSPHISPKRSRSIPKIDRELA